MRRSFLTISIPKGAASKVVTSSTTLGAFCVFYGLKAQYVGGVILGYTTRVKELCGKIGVGQTKFRYCVRTLKGLGLVHIQGKNLVLSSSRKAAEVFGGTSKAYYKFPITCLTKLSKQLRAWAIKENMAVQTYTRNQKLENQYLTRTLKGPINLHSLTPQARKRALSGYNQERELRIATLRFEKKVKSYDLTSADVNPHVTLSKQGVAKLYGKKSKGVGNYWVKMLAEEGLLEEQTHTITCGFITWKDYFLLQGLGILPPSYQCREGMLYKVLPNLLTPLSLVS